MAPANQELVKHMYEGVIKDVVKGLRGSFNKRLLMKLQQIWENKLAASEALVPVPDTPETSLHNQLTRRKKFGSLSARMLHSQPAASGGPVPTYTYASATPAAASAVNMVEIRITVPSKTESENTTPKTITVLVPEHALEGGTAGPKLKKIFRSLSVTSALALPVEIATVLLQQHIITAFHSSTPRSASGTINSVPQVDGPGDSDEEDYDEEEEELSEGEEEEQDDGEDDYLDDDPLNSDDDVSKDDFYNETDTIETANVVFCQFEKIARVQNRWKFQLIDGIMNINGRDYVFQKENGEALW